MAFLAPWMLFGALAASIPIILHFFYRSRFRDVPWAAMKFLLTAMEQTSRRLKFQELLLLILRVCILLLLALALARPSFNTSAGGGRGDAVDAAFVLDTSLSMQAKSGTVPPGTDAYTTAVRSFAGEDGTVTSMGRAKAAALSVLANLPAHSTVRVFAPTALGPRNPGHLDQARPLIEGIVATEQGTDLAAAIAEAGAHLLTGPSPNKELYVFSDMQKGELEARGSDIRSRLEALKGKVAIHFVHCLARVTRNIAIASITPQTVLKSGERAYFAVLVRNAGKEAVKNLTVTLTIDGNDRARETTALAEIGPGETRVVALGGMIAKPGRHVVSASVKPDDLDGDNRLDQVLFINDNAGVVIIDGSSETRDHRKASSYFLAQAINPVAPGSVGLPVNVIPAERASPRDLQGVELCILSDVRLAGQGGLPVEFTRALGPFVKDGKSLLVIAGPRVDPPAYNEQLFGQLHLLPYKLGLKEASAPEGKSWLIDRATAEGPFARFRDRKGYEIFDKVNVRRAIDAIEDRADTALAEESRVLLRYTNGKPAAASRRRPGQGEVMLCTTSLSDLDWCDWSFRPAIIPFVQVSVSHLLEGRPADFNRVAGEPLSWQVPRGEEEAAFDAHPPEGERRRLNVPVKRKSQDRHLVSLSETGRAGLYRITPAGREPAEADPLFAVAPDLRETENLTALSATDIDKLAGFPLTHATAGDDGAAFSGAERLRREWTTWLLAALLVLVGCEMALAWHCGRAY